MAEISVDIWRPQKLSSEDWRELQGIARAAFADTLDLSVVSEEDIANLVSWDDPSHFEASRINPMVDVGEGKQFNSNQFFTHGRVAVALENGSKPVGFGTSYWNTSFGPPEGPHNYSLGSLAVRMGKMATTQNHLMVRDLAVLPEDQYLRRGIGTQIARKLLGHALPWQPVTAVVWPTIDPLWIQPMLERHSFEKADRQIIHIFGEDSDPVWQVRMRAKSVRGVLGTIPRKRR